jgi:Domain of unknown function (DUF222)
MSGQVSGILEPLADAIDRLELPVDGAVLADAFALADRLHAKLVAAVADHDVAEVWRDDGATSMTAWLRHHGRRSGRDAAWCTKTGRRLRDLPVTAAGYRDGLLSGGQLQAIVANLTDHTAGLFADHEAELVPHLAGLSVADAATVMQSWARHADATVDDQPPTQPQRSLHLSRVLDGRRELTGSFDPEGGAVIATALRLAATGDVDGEPHRSPTHRRADALVDVCRRFLDHQHHHRGGRHRPHLNVTCSLDDLETRRGQGRLIDGTILDHTTVQRLLCDAGVHRVIRDGRSSILDYGTTTRTVPANLYNTLVILDRHCRFPGCDRPPEWTEAHHLQWISHGGPTRPDNLVLACSRHHHLLHTPGWHAKLLPDRTLHITTPTGHTLHSHPPP